MQHFVEFPLVEIPTVKDARGNLSFIQKGVIPFEPYSVGVCQRPCKEGFLVPLAGEIHLSVEEQEWTLSSARQGVLVAGPEVEFYASPGAIWLYLTSGHYDDRCSKSHGDLSAPFPVRRVYYLTSIPEGAERGGHSHLRQWVMIKVLRGGFRLNLDSGARLESYELSSSTPGAVVPPDVWRSMGGFQPDTIVLVLSSTPYDPSDYIYDHELFLRLSLRTIKI